MRSLYIDLLIKKYNSQKMQVIEMKSLYYSIVKEYIDCGGDNYESSCN